MIKVKNEPLISVIIPIYNTANYLESSIKSVLFQTYKNIEVILINDGSTDNSAAICKKIAMLDNRCKFYDINNIGVSAARNIGLEKASGDYIMFIDSDDTIRCNLIEILYRTIKKYKCDCAIGGCKYVNPRDSIQTTPLLDDGIICLNRLDCLERLCYLNSPYKCIEVTAVWGKLYSSKILQNVKFKENMPIGEDFVFNFDVLSNVSKAVYVNFEAYNYFIRNDSVMRNGFKESKMQTLDALEELSNINLDKCIEKGYLSRLVNIAIVLLLMIPMEKEYFAYRNRVIKFVKRYREIIFFHTKTRLKLRIALLISYFGFDNMQRLFEIYNNKLIR